MHVKIKWKPIDPYGKYIPFDMECHGILSDLTNFYTIMYTITMKKCIYCNVQNKDKNICTLSGWFTVGVCVYLSSYIF